MSAKKTARSEQQLHIPPVACQPTNTQAREPTDTHPWFCPKKQAFNYDPAVLLAPGVS